MLNKGQSEDMFEYILVSIAIIVGIVVLTLGHNYHEFSVQSAMQKISPDVTNIQSYDSSFLGTDLKNILDLQVSEDFTFAELISHLPEGNNPSLLDQSVFNGVFSCNDELFNLLNLQLDQVYSDNWIITVYSGKERIFICTPIFFDYSTFSIASMTIPSSDPKTNLEVKLEVYQ